MNFDEGQVDMGGGATWSNTFKNGTTLDEGTYILVTGQRMADGSVLAHSRFFQIKPGKNDHSPTQCASGKRRCEGDW